MRESEFRAGFKSAICLKRSFFVLAGVETGIHAGLELAK
jgi:hypothetical protein